MICTKCEKDKELTEFSKRGPDGYQAYCKQCMKENRAEWIKANPEKARFHRKKNRLRKYGITFADYARLWDIQNGCCAICERDFGSFGVTAENKDQAYVDHDHTTNKVRGLLCNNCNAGLGHFFDDIDRFHNAVTYLLNPVTERAEYLDGTM